MRKHEQFILTSVGNILADSASATSLVSQGMDSYPLCEYIMQSTFLRMTGFMEQKMKCISWELATDDYDYRYMRYSKRNALGEYSTYDEKQSVFSDLLKQIRKNDTLFHSISENERKKIVKEAKVKVYSYHRNIRKKGWLLRSYCDFEMIIETLDIACIGKENSKGKLVEIFDNSKKYIGKIGTCEEAFDSLVKHRNLCAHNLMSYEQNIPSFAVMQHNRHVFDNYYLRFFLLILMDSLFVYLFQKYIVVSDSHFNI